MIGLPQKPKPRSMCDTTRIAGSETEVDHSIYPVNELKSKFQLKVKLNSCMRVPVRFHPVHHVLKLADVLYFSRIKYLTIRRI